MPKFNVEEYRQPWETGPHWELKKEFIDKYSDMFEEDRLLCLAQAYSNVILMNCSYPAPVMQQISHLAEPLQMRKRFQENKIPEPEPSNNHSQRVAEKMKSIYEQSGRPFKQVKFCSSNEKQTNTSDPKQPMITCISSGSNQQQSETLSASDTNVCDQDMTQPSKSDFVVDISMDKEVEILRALGLDLIQNLAITIRKFPTKATATEKIQGSVNKLKINDRFSIKIEKDPDSPSHAPLYCSELIIDNCVISTGEGRNKKQAKAACSEAAVDILSKIAISPPSTTYYKEAKSLDLPNKEYISPESKFADPMKLFQILSEQIVKRTTAEPALRALRNISESLGVQDYVTLDVKISQTKCICKLIIKNILISSSEGHTPEAAKVSAVDSAFTKLLNLSDYEIKNSSLTEKQIKNCDLAKSSCNIFESEAGTNSFKEKFVLNEFLFYSSIEDNFALVFKDHFKTESGEINFRVMLVETAGFCKKKFTYEEEVISTTIPPYMRVHAIIGENIVGTGTASTKEDAKKMACSKAIDELRKKYYTIKVKNNYVEGFIITRSQVFEGESFTSNVLSENNVGCKMLKNMGWTGGSLGTSGIIEPVEATAQHSFGTGLGFGIKDSDMKLFRKRLDAMLQDFSKSQNFCDLVFAKDFTKEERQIIHKLGAKYGLSTQSRGIGDDRYLTVKQKNDVSKLLKYLASNGGSNNKFELLDASKTNV